MDYDIIQQGGDSMANEYVISKRDEKLGTVQLSKSVFESIIRITLEEMEGVFIVDTSWKSGVVPVVHKDNDLSVMVDVKLRYGLSAQRVSMNIQEKVVNVIKQTTDVVIKNVDVKISGFVFE